MLSKTIRTFGTFSNFTFKRNLKTLSFAGQKETVFERSDYPLKKIQDRFQNDTFCILGYGTQGRAQALNLRDNGLNVVVGLREGKSFDLAKQDNFIKGDTLLSIDEACDKSNYIMYMLSDAGQMDMWSKINPYLNTGNTLYFSHGLGIVYNELTGIEPNSDIDVIMVAPKGSGTSVRKLFLEGKGINSSIAVHQDYTGKALENTRHLAFGIGSGYVYETTFKKEVYSDLFGERAVLMGLLQGAFSAQYEVLIKNGHSHSEAFNETVEELTESLIKLVSQNGMDYMYNQCSQTARIGAIESSKKFKNILLPHLNELYESVKSGEQVRKVLQASKDNEYKYKLDKELNEIKNMPMWQTGKIVRSLRP